MLYTMSLFVLEPFRFIDRYEWRKISTLEKECHFTFWSEVARLMGIENIPGSIEQLDKWSRDYEEK